jgi:hypothetical protein
MPATGLGCPKCRANGVETMLMTEPNVAKAICPVNDDHSYKSVDELLDANPTRLPMPKQPDKVQASDVQWAFRINARLKEDFEKKHGEKAVATLRSLIEASLSRMVVLGDQDLLRIEEKLGQPIKTGSQIYGLVFEARERANLAESTLEAYKTQHATSLKPGALKVDLGDQLANAVAKAQERNETLEQYVSRNIREAIENNWTS